MDVNEPSTPMLAFGDGNIQVQYVGGDVTVRVGHAEPARIPLRSPFPYGSFGVRPLPSQLLLASFGVVPLIGRDGLVEELTAWANSGPRVRVRVVEGGAGSGKTRLGLEVAQRLARTGWVTGTLDARASVEQIEGLVAQPAARLVVIDYAEDRPERVEGLLTRATACALSDPLRVLLLQRRPGTGRGVLTEALLGADEPPVTLGADALSSSDRERLFAAAGAAFAAELEAEEPSATPDLTGPMFATPLAVLMSAYLNVSDHTSIDATSLEELLGQVLKHEQNHWDLTGSDPELARRVVAATTLATTTTEKETAAVLAAVVPELGDTPLAQRYGLARWARSIYPPRPGDDRHVGTVEPDRLGEHLIAGCLEHLDIGHLLAGEHPGPSLTTLVRTVNSHPDTHDQIATAVGQHLTALIDRAVIEAQTATDVFEGDRHLAIALTNSVAETDPPCDYPAAYEQLPVPTGLLLTPLAVELAQRSVAQLGELVGSDPKAYLPDLARSLDHLSNGLAGVGRHEEALEPAFMAADAYEELAERDPDTYLPRLAGSWSSLSNRLGELGRHEEALEPALMAADAYEELAEQDPPTHVPAMATVLNNLSVRLGRLGLHEEALLAASTAADLHEELAEQDPVTFLAELAGSLNNLSIWLGELGRHAEASVAVTEAVRIRRDLASQSPAVHLPELATALNNLSVDLGELGRHEEALDAITEAAEIRRDLAAENPAAYLPDFAGSLNNLSNQLGELGRHEEALHAITDAVRIRRDLAAQNPAAHVADLAMSVRNLSIRLAKLDRADEATAALAEFYELR
ncbi:MAG: tetratricopeptide repeat protein [Actinomycetota bacterium]